MNTLTSPARKRYESIDIAKAFAIILVVVGHFESPSMPPGYDILVSIIYMFHMPLFMFASGFLYQATRKPISYKKFIAGKFKRLMVPYFTVSILIILLKLCMSGIMPIDHPVTYITFLEIFYLPAAGYFLWFIWALWWMMVIIPVFKTRYSRRLLFAVSAILFFISPVFPEIFCLRQFAGMLIFFVGGTVVSDYMTAHKITSFSILWQVVSVIGFVVFAWGLLAGAGEADNFPGNAILTLTVNVLGIAMSMTMAYRWRVGVSQRLLNTTYSLAGASYIIYLLHTTFEGFAKGFLSKIHWFDIEPRIFTAWTGALIAISCGVIIPWWLGTKILGRWKPTAYLFGIPFRKKG